MKTKNLLSLIAIAGALIFYSCKKDDNTQKFSPLTVEQNKAKIEDNGIAMLNQVKAMESAATVQAAANMMDYMSQGALFENNPNMNSTSKVSQFKEFLKPVMIAAELKNYNAKQVANELKVKFSDPTLVQMWNYVKGTYTWNSTSLSWDYSTGTEIKIQFPSTSTGTTNNVVFRVYDFLYETGPFTWTSDYTGELPKQIKSELKVDQNVLLSYSLNITYQNTDKKPNSFVSILSLPPFKFDFEVTNNNDASASVLFKWTNDNNILALISLKANGNWSETNLNNDNLQPGNVISNGNATFQLMNIKVTGNVDSKNLFKELANISPILSDSLYKVKECELINKYANLAVCYVDNNLIIAKVIATVVKKTDTHTEYVYNSTTDMYELKTFTDVWYDINPEFQFADASTVDIDTYFGSDNSFSSLKTAVESYLEELQSKYY